MNARTDLPGYLDAELRIGVPPKREEKLAAARELIRSAGIRDKEELLEMVNNIVSAIDAKYATPEMLACRDQMTDSASDLEGPKGADLDDAQEVLEYSGRERGQFDGFTANVKDRG
jgi:hypothetical protein